MNYIDMPIFEPHHHHHHAPNPMELAQISGASQYAKLNMRLQRHIEDDDRHLRDGERAKWNKAADDLKLLKEELDGFSPSSFDPDQYIKRNELNLYVTRTELNNTLDGYATKNWVLQILGSYDFPQMDLSKYLKISDFHTYFTDNIRDQFVGTINGERLYWGGSVNIPTGGGGGGETTTVTFVQSSAVEEATQGKYPLGNLFVNGIPTTIYAVDTQGSGGGGGGDAISYWEDAYFKWGNSMTQHPTPIPTITNLNGWSTNVPTKETGKDYLWMIWLKKKSVNGGVATTVSVGDPICISGASGVPGKDGKDIEFIFARLTADQVNAGGDVRRFLPAITNSQQDDYVPTNWSDDPSGISASYPEEYCAIRIKRDGVWENFRNPFLWSKWGRDGIDGDSIEFIFSNPVPIRQDNLYNGRLLDKHLTLTLNYCAGLGNLETKSYVNYEGYKNIQEVVDLDGFEQQCVNAKAYLYSIYPNLTEAILWKDDPSTEESQFPEGHRIYAAIRRKTLVNGVPTWSEFSVPTIWAERQIGYDPQILKMEFFSMTCTPSMLKVDAMGNWIGGNQTEIQVVKVKGSAPEVIVPGSEGYENLKIRYKKSTENQYQELQGSTYTFENERAVTFVLEQYDEDRGNWVVIASQTVVVAVDTSATIVDGADGIDVSIQNDTWTIGCDSENKIIHYPGEDVLAKVKVYRGTKQLTITDIKINNESLINLNEIEFNLSNSAIAVIKGTLNGLSNEVDVCILELFNAPGYTDAMMDDQCVYIPLQITAYDNEAQEYYTRNESIKVLRINSGQAGVAPTRYVLDVYSDVCFVEIEQGSRTFYPQSTLFFNVKKVTSDGTSILSYDELANESLKLKLGNTSILINASSVDKETIGALEWIRIKDASWGTIYSHFGDEFVIQLIDSNENVHDLETITFVDVKNGEQGEQGQQGLQGCVIRRSILDDGIYYDDTTTVPVFTHYRNEENRIFNGVDSMTTRYIDIVGVPNSNATDGYYWFKVKPVSFISTEGYRIVPATANGEGVNNEYGSAQEQLTKFKTVIPNNSNTQNLDFEYVSDQSSAIYSSLIMAKYAKIKFQTNNELTIVKEENGQEVETAGLTGGGTGSDPVRIWAGSTSADLNNAPFRITESGNMYASNANVTGVFISKNQEKGKQIVIDSNSGSFELTGPVSVQDGTDIPSGEERGEIFNVDSVADADTNCTFGQLKLSYADKTKGEVVLDPNDGLSFGPDAVLNANTLKSILNNVFDFSYPGIQKSSNFEPASGFFVIMDSDLYLPSVEGINPINFNNTLYLLVFNSSNRTITSPSDCKLYVNDSIQSSNSVTLSKNCIALLNSKVNNIGEYCWNIYYVQ